MLAQARGSSVQINGETAPERHFSVAYFDIPN